MNKAKVNIEVDYSSVEDALNDVEKELANLPWLEMGENIKQSVFQNFAVGGRYSSSSSPIGGPRKWAPREESQPWPTLKKTGKLMLDTYVTALNNGIILGNRGNDYNAAVNFGIPSRGVPPRPFLVIQPEDLKKIEDTISSIIENIADKSK